ncbi:MAG: lysophospholipase, partial [Bacteroidaceae bacterium]|nr:lysophospholipase [Bacteroidaceae bacterium]
MEKHIIKSLSDDIPLSVLVIEPKGREPIGIFQIVHGMCEHKERYINFMEFMSNKGFICVIHDNRGHGES